MKKVILVAALIVAGFYGAQAQTTPRTTNSNNTSTGGMTTNSGVGNGTNGSSSSRGTTNQSGAVGTDNGTSYGMQSTTATNGSMKGMKKKDMKMKKKDSNM